MIEILESGPFNTVQDLGRPGYRDIGVSASGAMDPLAVRIGNILVGNDEDAAAIEVQTFPFRLRFEQRMCVVIGGVLLTGGTGSVVGIVIGTLTFAIVNQGIYFTGIDPNLGSVIIGALLLLAVMMNDKFRLMATSYAAKKKK